MSKINTIILENESLLGLNITEFISKKDLSFIIFSQEKIWKRLVPHISNLLIQFIELNEHSNRFIEAKISIFKEASAKLIEANKHLKINADIGMLLEFIKCYKKSYKQLVISAGFEREEEREYLLKIEDFFDNIEVNFSTTWVRIFKDELVKDFKIKSDIIIETLRKSEERYHQLVEQASDGIFIINPTGKYIEVNTKGHSMLGYTYEEMLNKYIIDLISPEETSRAFKELKELNSGKSIISEWNLKCKDGTILSVELSAKKLHDNSILGMVRDITERKKIEMALLESEERYRRLVDLIPDGIFMVNSETVSYVNDAGIKMLGAETAKEIQNKPVFSFIHPDYRDVSLYAMKQAMDNPLTPGTLIEKKVNKVDGTSIFVEARAVALQDKSNLSTLFVYRDITERKIAEENMKLLQNTLEYDKLKTEFFSNISHELRTPVNVIMSALQMCDILQKNNTLSENPDRVNRYFSIMKQNCYRLIKLVNNLIDITRIDSGYLQLEMHNHNIISIIEDITLSVADYIETKGISLIFDTDVEEQIMACDPDKIERIILNILSNAVKFTEPGGTITVSIKSEIMHIFISIKDTGVGIPEDKQKLVFERFVQVDKSLSRSNEGSGIGLSLVKSLVEMHNGNIFLKSNPNEGSEFIIKLPVHTLEQSSDNLQNHNCMQQSNTERINIEFSDIYS